MQLPKMDAGCLPTGDGSVKPYVCLGSGPQTIVVVPGAADGLRRCIDIAPCLAWFYRERAKRCRIVVLSRRDPIPEGFGVAQHAQDMIATLEHFGGGPAFWECISAAGPIGQQVAVQRPDLVQGLILSSTFDHTSAQTRKVLCQWMEVAQQRSGLDALFEMVEQKFRPPPEVIREMGGLTIPEPPEGRSAVRLTRILEDLLTCDQRELVATIRVPTLIIGGEKDRIVPNQVRLEMAARMPHAKVVICEGFGHFNDTDNPGYESLIQEFIAQAALCEATN